MSDVEDKVIHKNGEFAGNFSDMIKKVVEKELSGETAEQASAAPIEDAAVKDVKAQEQESFSQPAVNAIQEPEKNDFQWESKKEPAIESFQPVSEVGVISPVTSINGTVSSKGHIRIEGNVIGDVFAFGDVKVTGKVAGDIGGENIELDDCKIDGDIKARGDINVGKESFVSGNLNGQVISIDGKIKGDIEAVKGAHLSGSSSIIGSVSSPVLSMSTGAEIQGKVNVAKEDNL